MEKHYYCTAKTYFKTEQVLKCILEIFDEINQTEVEFSKIYLSLRDKLFVTSVNKKNLQALIGEGDIIDRNEIQRLYDESIVLFQDSDGTDNDCFVKEDYVISKKHTVPKAVVYNCIIEIFDEKQTDKLTFSQIQEPLAKKLGTPRVNMANLKALFS